MVRRRWFVIAVMALLPWIGAAAIGTAQVKLPGKGIAPKARALAKPKTRRAPISLPPTLTSARPGRGGVITPGTRIRLDGSGFGKAKKGRKVRLEANGRGVLLEPSRWSDTRVEATLTAAHANTLGARGRQPTSVRAQIGLAAKTGGFASTRLMVTVWSARPPTAPADADGDGVDSVAAGGADCDDGDPNRYPGNTEVCDRDDHDEDCDPTTFGQLDRDRDGFVSNACANHNGSSIMVGQDCNDARADQHPGLAETCDGRDNDCDGDTDEDAGIMVYVDADGDGYGSTRARTCDVTVRPYSLRGGDCDDRNAKKHPGAGCP